MSRGPRIRVETERPWSCEPWTRFGIEVDGPPPAPRPSPAGTATADLLALLTDGRTEQGAKSDALRPLAGREPAEGLIPPGSLAGHVERPPEPAPLGRAVERLGALAVPAARGWARDDRPWPARLGADVPADHPGPEAAPALVAELAGQ
ncbi:hypothetical protein [Streptomyces sp. NPDC090022]|uniref:hypothetical protein n=1 Tax=Streptomyces sp. NPDC090022 TaxID=3365920 RepID=UPI0037F32664